MIVLFIFLLKVIIDDSVISNIGTMFEDVNRTRLKRLRGLSFLAGSPLIALAEPPTVTKPNSQSSVACFKEPSSSFFITGTGMFRFGFKMNNIIFCPRHSCIHDVWSCSEFDLMQQDGSSLNIDINVNLVYVCGKCFLWLFGCFPL